MTRPPRARRRSAADSDQVGDSACDGHVLEPPPTLPDFDGQSQYDPRRRLVDGARVTYHAWVRALLAEAGAVVDPVGDVREQVRALAVEIEIAAWLAAQPHPGSLPSNT